MNPPPEQSDGAEYRPTDWLASCRMSYGIGHTEEQAIRAALQWAGPFDPETSDVVSVATWKLHADSWQSHGPSGPERSAEQLEYHEYEFRAEDADRVSDLASDLEAALSKAHAKGEHTYEEAGRGEVVEE